MLRVAKLTDYGTMVLAHMAARPAEVLTAGDLALALHLGPPTVSKVLKTLARHGLVLAFRGTHGGYSLARPPERITIADVIDAMEEQPFGLTECGASDGLCAQEDSCSIRAKWRGISVVVRRALQDVTLADMVAPPSPVTGSDAARGGTVVAFYPKRV